MQYRIYCEYLARILRMFGSLQSSNIHLQLLADKYRLRIEYVQNEYVEFIVTEQQFGIPAGVSITFSISSQVVELLTKIPLKSTKSDITIDIPNSMFKDSLFRVNYSATGINLNLVHENIEYPVILTDFDLSLEFFKTLERPDIVLNSLEYSILKDIVELNTKCALNQNQMLYVNPNKGILVLNENASIASFIDNSYFSPEIVSQNLEELISFDFVVSKPRFISNFLAEVHPVDSGAIKLYCNTLTDETLLELDCSVVVGKKSLFTYQLYLKFSPPNDRQKLNSLLDLKSQIQEFGKQFNLSFEVISNLLAAAKASDNSEDVLLDLSKSKKLSSDLVSRIFKSFTDTNVYTAILLKDKLLLKNDNVFTLTTLNIKHSDA